jgi:hypothetical protein
MHSSNTSVGYFFICIFFILIGCMNDLPLSLVHFPHHHLGTSHPYVNLPQSDSRLAHTSSRVDAQVSVPPPSRFVNIC